MVAQSRRVGDAMQDVALVRQVESDITSQIAAGVFDRDPVRVQSGWATLFEWNQRNPDMPIRIKHSQIQHRVREMAMSQPIRVIKSAPKEVRGDVAAGLQ